MAPRRQTRTPSGGEQNNETATAVREMARAMERMFDRMNQQGNAGRGPNAAEGLEQARFGEFRAANPPAFRGTMDPDKADEWIKSMEKIYSVVACSEEQKVTFAAYVLEADAEFWWTGTRRLLEASGTLINWELFKTYFYEKYFPESVRNAKDIEFMQLTQGGMSVAQYTAKFEELIKFSRVFQGNPDEVWKCVKYEAGLKAELNVAVAHMEIRDFPTLVNKCRILEEGHKKMSARRAENFAKKLAPQAPRFKPQHKHQSETHFNPHYNQQFMPQFETQAGPQFRPQGPKDNFQHEGSYSIKEEASQDNPAIICPKCGKNHGNRPCLAGLGVCFRCGKPGHMIRDCNVKSPQLNAAFRPQRRGQVFTINVEDTPCSDDQGKNAIYSTTFSCSL